MHITPRRRCLRVLETWKISRDSASRNFKDQERSTERLMSVLDEEDHSRSQHGEVVIVLFDCFHGRIVRFGNGIESFARLNFVAHHISGTGVV